MMEIHVRQRRRPDETLSDKQREYGPFASVMTERTRYFEEVRDRSTYVAITGQFPSHLRKEYTAVLRQITQPARNSSLDGLRGYCEVKFWPSKHLDIAHHPMYLAVKSHVDRGYRIQPSRGHGTRRGYGSIFMFRLSGRNDIAHQITIKIDGAVKQGWL